MATTGGEHVHALYMCIASSSDRIGRSTAILRSWNVVGDFSILRKNHTYFVCGLTPRLKNGPEFADRLSILAGTII